MSPSLLKLPTGRALRTLWNSLHRLPGGRAAFSKVFGVMVPYSGSVSPLVLQMDPGHARVQMRDRRGLRNHLESIHAIALMNLGELTSGLAMISGLPDDARAIITRLSMEYLKKARGTLVAECRCEVPSSNEKRELEVVSELRDSSGEVVARATARWLVGPA